MTMTMTQFQCKRCSALLLLCSALLLCHMQPTTALTTPQPKPVVNAGPQAKPQVVSQVNPLPKPQQRDAKCLQPLDPGPCRMSLERYYYNSESNTCETFKYGGCRGNDNRWGFRQTCEEACLPKAN